MKSFILIVAMIAAAALSGCSGEPTSTEQAAETPIEQANPLESLFVAEAPNDAIGIAALKAGEDDSDVVVTGIVGGRAAPFVEGRAMFTLADKDIPFCTLEEGCETPWDACCNPPEDNIAGMITVQVSDDGGVLAESIQGLNGLAPMSEITIRGDIVQRDDRSATLEAREIFVHAPTDSDDATEH